MCRLFLPWLVRPQQLGSEWPIRTVSPLHGDDRSFNAHTKIVFQQAITAIRRSKTAACQANGGNSPCHGQALGLSQTDPSPPNSVPTTRVIPSGRDAQCARNEDSSIFCLLLTRAPVCLSQSRKTPNARANHNTRRSSCFTRATHHDPSWTKQKGC